AQTLREQIGKVREILKGTTGEGLPAAVEELTKALHGVSTRLYQSGSPAGTSPPTPPSTDGSTEGHEPAGGDTTPGSGGEGQPVDADFKVVDRNKEPTEGT
ncbi:MAG: hypothetical protein ACYDFT_02980, partial [Thermoplasmata archaeon]